VTLAGCRRLASVRPGAWRRVSAPDRGGRAARPFAEGAEWGATLWPACPACPGEALALALRPLEEAFFLPSDLELLCAPLLDLLSPPPLSEPADAVDDHPSAKRVAMTIKLVLKR